MKYTAVDMYAHFPTKFEMPILLSKSAFNVNSKAIYLYKGSNQITIRMCHFQFIWYMIMIDGISFFERLLPSVFHLKMIASDCCLRLPVLFCEYIRLWFNIIIIVNFYYSSNYLHVYLHFSFKNIKHHITLVFKIFWCNYIDLKEHHVSNYNYNRSLMMWMTLRASTARWI